MNLEDKKAYPFFSVAMCVHDGIEEQHLESAIASILAQSFVDFEFLIYLDGVSKLSIKLILEESKHSDERVSLFSNPTNHGLAFGLNALVNQASSDWIVRMDADDYSRRDRLEKINEYLLTSEKIDVVGSFMSEFSRDVETLSRTIRYPLSNEEMRKAFCYRNPLSHASAAINKSFFKKAGQYPYVSVTNEDTYLWLSGFNTGCQFANIPDDLYYARFDESTLGRRNRSRKIISDCIDRLRVIIDLNGSVFSGFVVISYALLSLLPGSHVLRKLYFWMLSKK